MPGRVKVRASKRARRHTRSPPKHLYRGRGTEARQLAEFERRYGKRKGDYVYGAVVGKVAREREAAQRRR